MDEIKIKQCGKCKKVKPITEFGKRALNRDGFQGHCKRCNNELSKLWRLRNPEKVKISNKKTRIKNRAKRVKATKKWREENKDHVGAYAKEYKQRDYVKEKGRRYMNESRRKSGIPVMPAMSEEEKKMSINERKKYRYQRDETERTKAIKRAKKYQLKNKEKVSKYKTEWTRNKMRTDIHYRLKQKLSKRIWDALNGICKSTTTEELIGCTIVELMAHFELQFTEGMSWENYGKWHVDHIRPCASFDLSKESEQRECFNYTNLQPLWAFDNMSKGARY